MRDGETSTAGLIPHDARRDRIRRRTYLVGLAMGIPVVGVTAVVNGSQSTYVAIAYPLLEVFLVAIAIGLVTRRLPLRRAEQAIVVALSGFFLTSLLRAAVAQPDLVTARLELGEAGYLNIVLLVVLTYLAFDTRQALGMAITIFGVLAGTVAWRVTSELGGGAPASSVLGLVRPTVAVGALLALIHGLAHLKQQLAESHSRAETYARLAHADPLTGLANRRDLTRALQAHVDRSSRFAVVLLDLDGFKAINDTHGHHTGDAVLVEVAGRLAGSVRTGDLLGRWGGEEFLVVCPDADMDAAHGVAERCRRGIADGPFETAGRVTASFGVADARPDDTADRLLARADRALYEAKRAGRNQVVPAA